MRKGDARLRRVIQGSQYRKKPLTVRIERRQQRSRATGDPGASVVRDSMEKWKHLLEQGVKEPAASSDA